MPTLSRPVGRLSSRSRRGGQIARRRNQRRLLLEQLELRQVLANSIATSVAALLEDLEEETAPSGISRADTGGDYSDTLEVCYEIKGTATPGLDHDRAEGDCITFGPGEYVIEIPTLPIDDPYYEYNLQGEDGFETVLYHVTSWNSSDPEKDYSSIYETTGYITENDASTTQAEPQRARLRDLLRQTDVQPHQCAPDPRDDGPGRHQFGRLSGHHGLPGSL